MDSRRGSLNTATLRRPDPGFGLRVEVELASSLGDPGCASDIAGDGVVNFADLAIMKKAFFKKPGPAAGKP